MSQDTTRSAVAFSTAFRIKKGSNFYGCRDLRRPGIIYGFTAIDKRMTPNTIDSLTMEQIRKAVLKGDMLNCKKRDKPKFEPDRIFITRDVYGKFDISYISVMPNGTLCKTYLNPAFEYSFIHPQLIESYYEVLQKLRD